MHPIVKLISVLIIIFSVSPLSFFKIFWSCSFRQCDKDPHRTRLLSHHHRRKGLCWRCLHSFTFVAESEVVRDVKRKLCYVALDYESGTNLQRSSTFQVGVAGHSASVSL